MALPRMALVRQSFERPVVADVAAAVAAELDALDLGRDIRPGQSVALTAGSRGIANIVVVLRTVVGRLRKLGAKPFLIPAMGSHGGGTAEGQVQILAGYGITEESVGAPVRASMDVVNVGSTEEGFPVVLDRHTAAADHIGVVARVKPHTAYQGPVESGLLKMMMIGLGKHAGALEYHRILLEWPFDRVVRSVARVLRAASPIRFGLALIENAYKETARVAGVHPDEFERREEALLVEARALLPSLPVREADMLIVDEIGKDISGSGMDTNIVGRKRAFRQHSLDADQPQMRHIFVRGLTEKTHGNAAGIGTADFTTTRLVRAMDYRATVINCLTAGYPENANLPIHFETDREVIDAALSIVGTRKAEEGRVLRIRNTLQLDEILASEACMGQADWKGSARVINPASALAFDASGNLQPW